MGPFPLPISGTKYGNVFCGVYTTENLTLIRERYNYAKAG